MLITVAGLDDECCAQKVAVALGNVASVQGVYVAVDGRACVTSTVAVAPDALRSALVNAGYSATNLENVGRCPGGLTALLKGPWTGAEGLDVQVISRGEVVDLSAHAAPGKYTVYDFGADWCAPCHTTAAALKAYMGAHADVAVRAILLDAADAKGSFALPVVKQHLQFASGLPYLVVRAPNGRTIYEGAEVSAALSAVDAKRR